MYRRLIGLGILLSALAVLLTACSGGGLQSRSGQTAPAEGLQGPAPAAAPGTAPGGGSSPQPNLPASQPRVDRMIVYTARITLRVTNVGSAIESVSALADRYGGYVSGSTRTENDGSPAATVTLRVPAQDFQAVMAELRAGAERVLTENITSEDVTEEFTDLDAQLRSLRATEQQYLDLLRRANTVEDVLRVQQRLSEVRVQIERIEGRLRLLERRADLATITVTLTERPSLPGADPWDPGRIIGESWAASLRFLQATATVALRVVVFFWWVFPVLGLALLMVILLARRGGRRPA